MLNQVFIISIKLCSYIDKYVRKKHLENSQEFINWQDELNKISVQ